MRHPVINGHLLLTARAVEVAERNLRGCPAVIEHFLEAASVEDMAARELNTWFFAKFTAVTNSTELTFFTGHSNLA